MIKLSVNVNKVATVRNSRGGELPSVIEAVRVCIDAGAPGITVHPRADARHITTQDVYEIAEELAPFKAAGGLAKPHSVEFNIEGDPRPGFLEMVLAVKPDQCTLVPVKPGEITSEAGWPADTPSDALAGTVGALKAAGVRVSLFVDPEEKAIRWAKTMGADRVELYTEPFARAFERGPAAAQQSFAKYSAAANLAHELGVGVNAGHDLDLKNLTLFKTLPHLDEVSIGHALISRAIFVGLGRVVKEYIAALSILLLSLVLSANAEAGTRVTFSSADGAAIAGELYESSSRPAPGVVLVHMLSRSRGDWGGLPDRIRDAGLTALAIDLRGHGQSSGSAQDLQGMIQDVRAAASWLASRPNVRGDQIAIVGASLGASLALLAAADVPQVRAIGLLSPSLDYRGLRTDTGLLKRLGARSLWLAASDQDPLALRTLRDMAAEPSGPREQHVSTALAHGTALLDKDNDMGRMLVDWLRRSLLS